ECLHLEMLARGIKYAESLSIFESETCTQHHYRMAVKKNATCLLSIFTNLSLYFFLMDHQLSPTSLERSKRNGQCWKYLPQNFPFHPGYLPSVRYAHSLFDQMRASMVSLGLSCILILRKSVALFGR